MQVARKLQLSAPSTTERGLKVMINVTPHPQWVKDLLDLIRPDYNRIVNHKFFGDLDRGVLRKEQLHSALTYFYPLIESFPKYMALSLAKVPAGHSEWSAKTSCWLSTNIGVERLHAKWWRQFAIGFGLPKGMFDNEIRPPAEVDAINNYLWRVCKNGSLAECIGAVNFAVEGPTGEWTKKVLSGIKQYDGIDGIQANEETLKWVTAHAHYDDRHPEEAMEIMKAYSNTINEQIKVSEAVKRTLEYYALALDACYRI